MQYFTLVSFALLPTLALAGTISFASNSDCEDGIEQTPASDTCAEAPEGSRTSFLVTDMGGCDDIGFYDGEGCDSNDQQAYYSSFDILEYCLAPEYSFTHYKFSVC